MEYGPLTGNKNTNSKTFRVLPEKKSRWQTFRDRFKLAKFPTKPETWLA